MSMETIKSDFSNREVKFDLKGALLFILNLQ
jgi:hypothetical protein